MLILVTNDDGIHSPGILELAGELAVLGEVFVIAPDRERSAASRSLTLHSPLRAEKLRSGYFAVDGTPTDCVSLGVHGLLAKRPDLIVSGINMGGNLGDDITYSGTVAAAMEGTMMGVPSFAISLETGPFKRSNFTVAARFAASLGRELLSRRLPDDTFLNVNVPAGTPRGVRLTRQGKRIYSDLVEEKTDPRGRKYYWLGGGNLGFQNIEGTDFHAIHDHYVSITPLHLDLTNYSSFEELSGWSLKSQDFSSHTEEGAE